MVLSLKALIMAATVFSASFLVAFALLQLACAGTTPAPAPGPGGEPPVDDQVWQVLREARRITEEAAGDA